MDIGKLVRKIGLPLMAVAALSVTGCVGRQYVKDEPRNTWEHNYRGNPPKFRETKPYIVPLYRPKK